MKKKGKIYKEIDTKEFEPNAADKNLFEHSSDPKENIDLPISNQHSSVKYINEKVKAKKTGFDFINKIICGDSIQIMKKLPSSSVDLVVTSPPYNLKNSTGNGMTIKSSWSYRRSEHYHGDASTTDSDADSLPKPLESQQMPLHSSTLPKRRFGKCSPARSTLHGSGWSTNPACWNLM